MRPAGKHALTALAAAAIATVIAAVPVVLRTALDDRPSPDATPTPAPGIAVVTGEVKTAPQVGAGKRDAAVAGISRALEDLYAAAFEQPRSPQPGATPGPKPASRVRPHLTQIANDALAGDPGVFDQASDLSLYTGRLSWNGVITFAGDNPVEAFVHVDFSGEAVPVGVLSPAAKVKQTGTLVLRHVADGGDWLVDGFDLDLATRPLATPTPAPT